MKKSDLHYKQIPTTYKAIKEQLETFSYKLPKMLIKCILNEKDILSLTVASAYLEMLSRYVYSGKDNSYKKPKAKIYKIILFEHYAETASEVKSLADNLGEKDLSPESTHKVLWQIADLVCEMMAVTNEQATLSEYVYAIKYVIENTDNLPKPEMNLLFPENYENYNYWEFKLDFTDI